MEKSSNSLKIDTNLEYLTDEDIISPPKINRYKYYREATSENKRNKKKKYFIKLIHFNEGYDYFTYITSYLIFIIT